MAGDFGGETAAFYARFRRGYPAAFTRLLTDALRLGPADVLADVGCGTGQLTLPLARRVRAVAGVDPEPDMLVLARQAAAEQGVTNVTWVAGTDRDLPGLAALLGAPALAAVTIANAIHLTSAPDLFAAARGALRPGGGLAIIANGTPLWQQPVPWSRAVRRGLEQWLGVRLDSCCGTDAAARQAYQAGLITAGYTGVHQRSMDYTGELDFAALIGGLYSAMPPHRLPPPERRAAFAAHIRDAVGGATRFTEQVHVAALIGYRPADLSLLPGTSPLPCGAMRILAGFGRFSLAVAAGAALAATAAAPLTASAAVVVPAARQLPDFGNPAGHAAVPAAGQAVNTSRPDQVVGSGTPAGCTSAAVVKAVAHGGVITFNCGPNPVVIKMTATAKLRNTSHQVVLDGGGLVTLNGGGKHQILYLNTCDAKQKITTSDCYDQQWPQLTVQNITLENGNSQVRQSASVNYGGGGGGAIFDLGGQLKVVNTRFLNNRCYAHGPDLGGAAVRALAQWRSRPVYITKDTFTGGRCSNGGALSSIGVSWVVTNSVMTNNRAIGYGQNPAQPGTAGGGSGGAIYNDGDRYYLKIVGTVIRNNHAREGGGAIFFVSDNNTGWLTIKNSTLHNNPSAVFWTRPYPGIFFDSKGHPRIVNSRLS
jgi:SAM-dependent methyltransferase